MNLTTPLGRLRLLGLLEGWSFVVLLFVAMPLKYWAGEPAAVKIVGMGHGVLFILCGVAALLAHLTYRWPLGRTALIILATLVPFGPFVAERRILRPLQDAAGAPVSA